MFAVVLQYKFPSIAEAKMASANLSEALGGKIATFDIHGLNIMLGEDGEVSVTIRFEEAKMLRKFEDNMDMLLEDIKAAFVFKENKFFGVCVYSFEREAVSTAISLEGPVSVVGA